MKKITLAHGNGGAEAHALIQELFFHRFGNDILHQAEDAALIDGGRLAMTTDSFTVKPIFFSGGDIGKLSICGTCNDLAMMAAQPRYLSCAFILEEGFRLDSLGKIVISMHNELTRNGAAIVCGDTKVIPRGGLDQIIINITGVGEIRQPGISAGAIRPGDIMIVSNSIGRHGAAIFADREGIELNSGLTSDCASLWPTVRRLIRADLGISALRDATRGGVAAVLNEWAGQSALCLEIEEEAVPVSREVRGVCELLGIDPLTLANEGTFMMAVDPRDADRALDILRQTREGKNAMAIGQATDGARGRVIVKSGWGTTRFLEMPTGEILPRIC